VDLRDEVSLLEQVLRGYEADSARLQAKLREGRGRQNASAAAMATRVRVNCECDDI
jgi:hypothetical protein